jgi:hypothetical protein
LVFEESQFSAIKFAGKMDMSSGSMDGGMGSNNNGTLMTISEMSMTFFTSLYTPLYSSTWAPTSQGAYAGTCIFLVCLATLLRFLLAFKGWKERAWLDAEFNRRYVVVQGKQSKKEEISNKKDSTKMLLTENGVEEEVMVVKKRGTGVRPWRLSIDPVRAVMDTAIAGVGYLL